MKKWIVTAPVLASYTQSANKGSVSLRLLLLAIIFPALLEVSYAGHLSSPAPSLEPPINEPLSQSAMKASSKVIFQRVIQARVFHSGSWTLSGSSQTPVSVARTLASLQPTFVTGLLRLPDHEELSNAEVEAYEVIRSAILASSKNCRFDVLINAGEERSGESFVRQMKECSQRIHPDAWTFYVAPEIESISPEVFEKGISEAHAAGQMVGYDGPLSLIPEGVDYIVVRAWNLANNRKQVDLLKLKQRVPLIFELPTTFGSKDSPEVASYAKGMNSGERVAILTNLAENQSSWGYRFAYPIFYPLYPARHAFDSTKDNMLLVSIRALLAKYN